MTTATKYKTYPKYKPSQTEWLDQVPENWDEKRLKFLISQKITDGPHETPAFILEGVPFLSVDGIQNDQLVFEGCRYISLENHAQYKLKCFPRKGDILLGKAASVGKVAIVDVDFEFNVWSPLALIRANKQVFPKYIYYSFKADTLQDQVLVFSTSNTQHNLSMDDIPELWLTFPNIDEQKKIVAFLDCETAKIDEMVAKKQKMIDLLKEKRQALITHAVTKGLDPKAKMKPSGIDWLGDIPEEWKIKKLKHIVKSKRGAIKTGPFGSDLTRDDYVFDEESSFAKIYTQQNIIENDLSLGDDYITEEKYLELIACTLEKDDVVLTTRGTLGRSMIFTAEAPMGIMHPCLLRVQLDERHCLKEFFQLLIQESHYFLEQLVYISNATTIEVLYGDTLKPMQIALPNIFDQKKILEYVAQKSKSIDEMMKKVEMQIEKLQEYRQALITNAVTGKIEI